MKTATPSATTPWKPTKAQLLAAHDKTLPDILGPNLRVLFCGINPGLYTAAVGHHFARPGNRFWPALFQSGITKRLLSPFEENELLDAGYGITNVVNRATATAAEISPAEFAEGGKRLEKTARRLKPRIIAFLGLGAYRAAFQRPKAALGPQPEQIGASRIWALPNPSGLNANHQLPDFTRFFTALRVAAEKE